ncbi:hypothetical protein A6770_18495 [Nostoc minutum NIES-26]|uniref:Uncharacterized protein n=1 Tax=Nostoc minutum NIES-26 TaxID=1844469 RepID=A0A367RB52_9NOSO|nr:hypothetical protein A6770_18495 [Nostoc minutum NIES-26]
MLIGAFYQAKIQSLIQKMRFLIFIVKIVLSKSVGKNTTMLRKINEAKTLFPPAFCPSGDAPASLTLR